MVQPPSFEIIVGTYEEFLLGYKIQINEKDCQFKQSFATHEHSSSVRCVATEGKLLASGGADDRICIYDMVTRKEHVMLTTHNSTVNCLEFTPGNTHLISSSTDGTIAVTRVGNWVLEKVWNKAHKNGYPLGIAIHPTGKLFFSFGSDSSLNTWNLIKGRIAYKLNLNNKIPDAKSLNFLKLNPSGEKFIIGGGMNIQIWNIKTGDICNPFSFEVKVTCGVWLTDDVILIGFENGMLKTLDIETEEEHEYKPYDNRVKCLALFKDYLVSASSSGCVKLWSVDGNELKEMASCNTGCRVTCLTLVDALKVKKEEVLKEEEVVVSDSKNVEKKKIQKQRVVIEEDTDEEDDLNPVVVKENKKKKEKSKEVKDNKNVEQKKKKRKFNMDNSTLGDKDKTKKQKLDVSIGNNNSIVKNKKSKPKKSKMSEDWNVETV